MSLDEFDTSYWLTKDKVWVEERKLQWPAIEAAVGFTRNKTEVKVIKQYFLKGKLPKWEKYHDWDDCYRTMDLNTFLWLHPSSDPSVLKQCFKVFVESNINDVQDVICGLGGFLEHEFIRASSTKRNLDEYQFPYMGEKNIVLFRIMFGNLDYIKNKIRARLNLNEMFDREASRIFSFLGFSHFVHMWLWLLQDSKAPLSENCLYQYEEVVDWSLTTIADSHKNEFLEKIDSSSFIEDFYKAFYCFHNFDTEKEGDTIRTQFIHKIRKILDEHDFIPEFKQIWLDIKAGKIEVEDPWTR